MRLLRVIVILVILAIAGLTGYAYLGDMGGAPVEMRVPVELDLGAAEQTATTATTDAPQLAEDDATEDSAPTDGTSLD